MSRTATWIAILLSVSAIAISSFALLQVRRMNDPSRVMEARGLIIKDTSGQMRVAIGAPVPDPAVRGVVGKRIAPASGLLIFDPDGTERGGYLTTDQGEEALLTLDSNDGQEVMKIVANPNSGASLFVLHGNGAGAMLTTYQGRPELRLIDQTGKTIFSQPASPSKQ